MTRAQREVLSQPICNFYCDAANKSVKTTVNYFKKQNIPQNTVYYILKNIYDMEQQKTFLEMIVQSNYPRKI